MLTYVGDAIVSFLVLFVLPPVVLLPIADFPLLVGVAVFLDVLRHFPYRFPPAMMRSRREKPRSLTQSVPFVTVAYLSPATGRLDGPA